MYGIFFETIIICCGSCSTYDCIEQRIGESAMLIHFTTDDVRNAEKTAVRENEYHKNARRDVTSAF